MNKRILVTTTIVALITLLIVPLALAQRAHRFADQGEFGPKVMLFNLQRAKARLGLTDQQVSDVQAIFQTLRQQNEPYRQSLRGGMQAIMQTLLKNPNDIGAAQALLDQQTEAERAMKANLLNATSKALAVLTPDQRTQLSVLIEERMSHSRVR
jgi:Spy/CpxP family protein refolding chaperone